MMSKRASMPHSDGRTGKPAEDQFCQVSEYEVAGVQRGRPAVAI